MPQFLRMLYARFQGSSVLSKLLIFNLIFIFLLSSLLSYNYLYLKKSVTAQVLQSNENFLEQFSNDFSKEWDVIRNMVYNVSVRLDTKFLSNNPSKSRPYYSSLLAYTDKITDLNLQLPFRAQLSTYFPNQDLVISSDGTRDLKVFYESLDLKNKEGVCRCLHQSEQLEQLYNFNQIIVYTYRLFPEGYIFVQIDKAELLTFLNNATKLLGNVIVLSDTSNQTIVSTASLNTTFNKQIQEQQRSAGLPVFDEKGETFSTLRETRDIFTYSVLVPKSIMQERLKTTNLYTFVLFTLFLAVNLGFLFANWSIVKPLRHITKTLNQVRAGYPTRNEFTIIRDTFKELNTAKASMQLQITEQSTIMEHNTLLRLLSDADYHIDPNVKRMLQSKFCQYALLSFIEENEHGKAVDVYAPLLESALLDTAPYIRLYAHDDRSIFIISCSDTRDLEMIVVDILNRHVDLGENGLTLCGLSAVHTHLEQIGKALNESMDAINKHVPLLETGKQVFHYQNWNSDKAPFIHLSIDKEQELVNYTLKGNSQAIVQFFDKIIERTLHTLTLEQFRNMLRYLHDLLLVIANSKKISSDELWETPPDIARSFHLSYLYQQIKEGYYTVAQRSAHPNTPLLDQIKNYINKQFSNPDLSLTLIADHFEITHVYLSTYFKKHSGYNLIYYMHLVRIQAAIKLIQAHPQLTMKEIAEKVGYSNDGTFIRHFKKISGTTPTQHARYQQE